MDLQNFPEVFCWSKVGSEAGQTLGQIVQRKEIERRANNGCFAWGVGSSLGESADLLRKATNQAMVVFTPMLSKPKRIDEQPKGLLLWLSGRTRQGDHVDLPQFSLLTSRGNTESAARKKIHYALLCKSKDPVKLNSSGHLNGASVVNLKSGNPVGSSQVTAIVKRSVQENGGSRLYKVGFTAELSRHIQVILDRFIEVSQADLEPVMKAANEGSVEKWKYEVGLLKKRAVGAELRNNKFHQFRLPMFTGRVTNGG